jgi:hypothetical protein
MSPTYPPDEDLLVNLPREASVNYVDNPIQYPEGREACIASGWTTQSLYTPVAQTARWEASLGACYLACELGDVVLCGGGVGLGERFCHREHASM